jgi:hypothetical protein
MRMVTDQGVLVIHACAQPVVSCYCKGFLAVLDGLYTYGHCQKRRYATTPGLDACCAFLRRMMDSCVVVDMGTPAGPKQTTCFLLLLSSTTWQLKQYSRCFEQMKDGCCEMNPLRKDFEMQRFFGVCKWRTAFYAPFEVLKWLMNE